LHRVDWRDLDLPANFPTGGADEIERLLADKPVHWRKWWDGELVSNYEAPAKCIPATLTADQVREVNARIHVENELIDEALGRILRAVDARGWGDETDVVYTTDHGELQGDFGFLFKGPLHVDSLMRLPLIWRPAPSARATTASGTVDVHAPVGLVDLAPTFCTIAGVPAPGWMDGETLPASDADAARRAGRGVLTEWDSFHPTGVEVHLQTIFRDGYTCTAYEKGTVHDGTEGELYDTTDDPLQRVNRWDDPAYRSLRDDLVDDLRASLPARPEARSLRRPQAPV
jgi:arylsulfatase A-like enzyme